MNCFISNTTNIYYNLALEEFLLKNRSEDFFFLWQSDPAIVVGKHQNPYKESDFLLAKKQGLSYARRLSGGGTVYQDLGNVNFTFIKSTDEGKQINLKEHSLPIFNALKSMGLPVEYSKRNDLLLDGYKISGNAEHVYKNRVLHHGTLLFDSDLDLLEQVLNIAPKYKDKSIASVRSKVTNIKPFLEKREKVDSFMSNLLNLVVKQSSVNTIILSPVSKLDIQKYQDLNWIFGYTPSYEFRKCFVYQENECQLYLKVKKGEIIEIELINFDDKITELLELKLINKRHLYTEILKILELPKIGAESLIQHFF